MSLITYPFPQPNYGPYLTAPPVNNTGLDGSQLQTQFPQSDYVFQNTDVCLFSNVNPAVQPVCSPVVNGPQPQYVLVSYPSTSEPPPPPPPPSVPEPSYFLLFGLLAGLTLLYRVRGTARRALLNIRSRSIY